MELNKEKTKLIPINRDEETLITIALQDVAGGYTYKEEFKNKAQDLYDKIFYEEYKVSEIILPKEFILKTQAFLFLPETEALIRERLNYQNAEGLFEARNRIQELIVEEKMEVTK